MKRLRASATVEAAFIVPLIFFVTIALIVLILMLYDRMKLKGDVRSVLEQARMQREIAGAADERQLKELLEEKFASGYLFCDVTEPVIEVRGDRITVSAAIAMRSPAGKAGFEMPGISRVTDSTAVHDREMTMRIIDAGKELLEKVTE